MWGLGNVKNWECRRLDTRTHARPDGKTEIAMNGNALRTQNMRWWSQWNRQKTAKRVHDSPWLQLSSRSNTLLSKPSSRSGTESWRSSGGIIPLSRIRFRSCVVMVNTSDRKIMTINTTCTVVEYAAGSKQKKIKNTYILQWLVLLLRGPLYY